MRNAIKIPYHSPHKFRHGCAVFSLKHAENIGQLKAISQNLMHANISITDGIYGILSESDIRKQMEIISNIASKEVFDNEEEIISYLEKIKNLIDNNKTKFGSF